MPCPPLIEKRIIHYEMNCKLKKETHHHHLTINNVKSGSPSLLKFERDMVGFVHVDGYDQRTNEQRWTFPAALMFALGMISMIGYGDVVPRSEPGKIATLAYATFGIPVYVLYFMSMGKVFANVLKWVYTKAYREGRRSTSAKKEEFFGNPSLSLSLSL